MVRTQENNNIEMGFDEDQVEDDNEVTIITSNLQHVLASKSRRLPYTSSPAMNQQHVSLSQLSSPGVSFSRATVPFSWEEEPGKPKRHIRHPSYSKCLDLPPRMLPPDEFTRMPLTVNHPPRLAGWKRWFQSRKERDGGDCYVIRTGNFVYPTEDEDGMKTTRTGGLHCFSYVTRCYFW